MILLDKNNKPTNTVYYISAVVYTYLSEHDNIGLTSLYNQVCESVLRHKVNFTFFLLAIDFLFLINKINIDEKGDLYVY
ncbi:hypothetical protein H5S40_10525 [Limosilactobacillus sp. RRLNB_1_1]|uniref:Uncharacterized protein n=2 Tax=Limosilactobacillus albertensis TaxID=2759752 RepID=A0A7W3TTI6_9LACO|nr:ABC-three component system middle component 6 [Limosilactobacillus albertensis]MBB1070579.1 hypothetical protein [Limosilactobacillus albertensis]